jgi:hypothetical protein
MASMQYLIIGSAIVLLMLAQGGKHFPQIDIIGFEKKAVLLLNQFEPHLQLR